VLGTARALLGYASFGAPPDSVRALHQRTERLVRQWVEPGSRAPARNALLAMPALLAFPLLGAEPVDQDALRDDYLVAMRDELRRGDSAAVRGRFAALAASRALLRPGDVSIDAAFAESRVLLELADTAAAVAALDASLGAIDGMDDRMLRVVPMTVSLVRAMALRADLAARRGDRVTARRWARPVIELWSGGDAALAPLIAHLRALSGA
jgi:hypothetical protein